MFATILIMMNDPTRLVKMAIVPSVQLLFAVLLLSWHTPPALANSAGAADYAKATKLLTQGKNFEEAITLLQDAVKADPKNADYHLALGCAYADRAASVGHAFEFQQMHAHYIDQYKDRAHVLDKVRQQWGVGTYLKIALPAPSPPPAFKAYTKDDGKPFDLTQDQVVQQMAALGAKAMQEWRSAVGLAGSKSARAHAEYVQGYGLEMLSQYAKLKYSDDETDAPTPTLPGYPSQDDGLAALRAAAKDAPKNPLYWEGLGAELYDMDFDSKEAISDFRESLALRPRKSMIWYILFDSLGWKEAATDNFDLKMAEASDPNNAFAWYLVAYRDTERTPLVQDGVNSSDTFDILKAHPGFRPQDARLYVDRQMAKTLTAQNGQDFHAAIVALETGNRKPFFAWPRYEPPVPSGLLMAWRYSHHEIGPTPVMSRIRELARATTGIADVSAIEGHTALARREAQDIVVMGQRIANQDDGVVKGDKLHSITQKMMADGVEAIGYSAEGSVAIVAKDKAAQQAAQVARQRSQKHVYSLLGESEVSVQFVFPYWDF